MSVPSPGCTTHFLPMASLRQVATACDLSLNAVSEILNRGHQARYRPETCARVQEVARRLNYVPNRAAQAMRSRRTRVIGFVTENASAARDTLYHTSLYSFVVGLSHALIEAGHHLAVMDLFEIAPLPGDPRARMLDEVFFDGMVIHQGRFGVPEDIERRVGVPVIWYDGQTANPQRQVRRDEIRVGRQLVEGLIAQGHQRIASVISADRMATAPQYTDSHYSLRERQAGYDAAMGDHHYEPLVIPSWEPSIVAAAISRHQLTALVCQGTTEFVPLLMAAQLAGKLVPKDLSLAAFDVDARHDHGGIQPGGVVYDRYAAGQRCAANLLHLLAHPEAPPETVSFSGDFSPGDTVGRCP